MNVRIPLPTPRAGTEMIGGDARASLASLGDLAPAEWEEAGIGPDSRVFGLRVESQIVAVAGYERWSGQIAQLHVFCHPGYRRGAVWLLSRSGLRSPRRWPTTCCPSIGRVMAMRRASGWLSESGSLSTVGWLQFASACLTAQCSGRDGCEIQGKDTPVRGRVSLFAHLTGHGMHD
jgi:hypothetical protein